MDSTELLERVSSINVMTVNGRRAPHKPLLMLLALRRLLEGRPRLSQYMEIEKELLPLLKRFNGHVRKQNPAAPFGWLRTNRLWEIPNSNDLPAGTWGTLFRSGLVKHNAEGGFPEAVYDLLKSNHLLLNQAVVILLTNHFPPSLHGDILEAIGLMPLDTTPIQPGARNPRFRPEVLRAYGRVCAICKYDVGIDGELFGLEAAHIRWHSHGGPDEVSNGLALCTFHHKAFDAGAIGLESVDGEFHLLLSSGLHGQSETLEQLKKFHRQPIGHPGNRAFYPDPKYVQWHIKQVFRGPEMDIRSS